MAAKDVTPTINGKKVPQLWCTQARAQRPKIRGAFSAALGISAKTTGDPDSKIPGKSLEVLGDDFPANRFWAAVLPGRPV